MFGKTALNVGSVIDVSSCSHSIIFSVGETYQNIAPVGEVGYALNFQLVHSRFPVGDARRDICEAI